MRDFEISIEQYRGIAYDIGYQQGQQIDRSLIGLYSNIINEKEIDIDELINLYSLHAPHLLDELKGIADSIDIPLSKAVLFSGYGAPEIKGMGCSSIVNSNILIRNYDFSPEVYDARLVFIQPDESYASVGHSLHVTGRTEGVNEKGLAIALHFVNSQDTQNGFTAAAVIRIILDTCKSTEEAIKMIKQLPHSWSYNFSIGDSNGNTVVVEQSPFNIKVRESKDILYCTNHFQRDDMQTLNRDNLEGTQERLSYLNQSELENNNNLHDIFKLFRNESTPLYNDQYIEFFGTLHTFAYLFDEGKVLTAIPNGKVLEIDLKEWVNGKDLNQNELKGRLNYS
ncbi:MAG TPA: C45 family peptidase [Virgibacillus sp.]|nr:C45 family peptidase [Virgibacillus sp.]HLR67189.1 C45 family peptidase [Virgibacillus sp.]